jgi:hypothetical protein
MTCWSILVVWWMASCSESKLQKPLVLPRNDKKKSLDVSLPSSICYNAVGIGSSDQYDCTDGEVQLLGRYVHVGFNNVGSLGTVNDFSSSYYNGQLGIIADYDKNGFANGSPGYSGDFFVSTDSLEGTKFHEHIHCILLCLTTFLFFFPAQAGS